MALDLDPLHSLLHIMSTDGAYTIPGLARRLGVTSGLLEQMLTTLERARYVRGILADCDRECKSCPSKGACGFLLGSRIWTVTPKGRQALKEFRSAAGA